jgi:bla regulator protein blaR1
MRLLTLAIILFAGVTMFGEQSQSSSAPLAFEAASIRPTSFDRPYTLVERNNPGYFTMRNVTVRALIAFAYFAMPYEVVEGPEWIDRDRFDVVAVAQGRSVRDNYTMVQTLLADRLSLRLRKEMREMPVYVLLKARDDGRLGPGLRPVTIDCNERRASGQSPCFISPGRGSLRAVAMQWSAVWFAGSLDRPLIDRSGLSGQFDVELKWTQDALTATGPADVDSVSLPTALREQLGLKLEPARAPIDVMVVEHVQRPSEN